MEIKNIVGVQPLNESKAKAEKRDGIPVTFQEYMQQRLRQTEDQSAGSQNSGIYPVYGANGIEAVAARSKIYQNTGGDVTDFLGLIQKQPFLLAGVDLSGLEETSGGAKALSTDDIQSLRERYDLGSLPKEKQAELVRELTGLGAVTKADAQKLKISVSPDDGDLMGYIKDEAGFTDVSAIDADKPAERLEAMIRNERFAYNHVLERYGKRASSVSELADSHKRVLATLKQI